MKFSFVTLFPDLIKGYFSESILKRAIEDEKIAIDFYNPRDFTTDKHNRVDAPMIGGGAGMLMTPQPLMDTLRKVRETSPEAHVVFVSPVAKPFTQNDARRLAKKSHVVLVSGRYEGIDERVIEAQADELFSIGDFILTGGELASMVVCDAISRNVEGVLGNIDSLSIESFEESLLEAPSFTKPKNYENNEVVSEFLKGNHSKITDLKRGLALCKTKYFRPDLYKKGITHEK
ncbi:tRNA (guanine-N(1)-)-methyltransferase [Sulfurovum sp. TSL6]|uniref:tRNA (guanosine(37)-N1)-methyltransferase TrmD n=1 Tax=Sulfurovum sp. TSL6 TaxID=2826995 RepID=UPI001CC67BC4|nr:tRNA (guanosine(37)-N1)-methyltransferase TrmD [Sulfurovum sp. TSL6]GIU01488.1 tRNA (guanine-N(1)-)-methyltransferase [Sulfurovum sp. TSL6]